MMKRIMLALALACLTPIPIALASIKVQVVLPTVEGANLKRMEPNSEGHTYSYAQTDLSFRTKMEMVGSSFFVDTNSAKNNTQQDKLRHFVIMVTGKKRIGQLDAALKECIAGGTKMKATQSPDTKAIITAEVDELFSGTSGGVALATSGDEGDNRSFVNIDRLDQGRMYASVRLVNPKLLSCKFLSASAPTPKL
jgi:hypothetical protein